MQITDSFTIESPLEQVWDFLFDVEQMSGCMPGVESVEMLEEDLYQGVLKVKIGPVSAQFVGKATVTEKLAPERLVAVVEATDKSSNSLVKATFSSDLIQVDEGTRIDYIMDINLRGKMAQFGSAVMKATAKKMTNEFSNCIQVTLSNGDAR